MRNILKNATLVSGLALTLSAGNMHAQSYEWISSTEGNTWQQSKIKLQTSTGQTPILEIDGSEDGTIFKAWGTCFNGMGRTQYAPKSTTGDNPPATFLSRRRLEIQYGAFFDECQRLCPRLVQLR